MPENGIEKSIKHVDVNIRKACKIWLVGKLFMLPTSGKTPHHSQLQPDLYFRSEVCEFDLSQNG